MILIKQNVQREKIHLRLLDKTELSAATWAVALDPSSSGAEAQQISGPSNFGDPLNGIRFLSRRRQRGLAGYRQSRVAKPQPSCPAITPVLHSAILVPLSDS